MMKIIMCCLMLRRWVTIWIWMRMIMFRIVGQVPLVLERLPDSDYLG